MACEMSYGSMDAVWQTNIEPQWIYYVNYKIPHIFHLVIRDLANQWELQDGNIEHADLPNINKADMTATIDDIDYFS